MSEKKEKKPIERLKKRKYDVSLFLLPVVVGGILYFIDPAKYIPLLTPAVALAFIPGLINLIGKFESLSHSIDISQKKIIPRVESSQQFQKIFNGGGDTVFHQIF
jgi:hypothetical protein